MSFKKGDKKIINAWCWFDWANSVYPLVITTAVFPIYFAEVTKTGDSNIIEIMGFRFVNSEFYSYLISLSFLIVALINPVLSGIADFAGKKKSFMQFFSTMGAIASASLFFFTGMESLWIGVAGSVVASVGFAGSLVFYNAFLPEIVEEKDLDMVSARGFTMGYLGSSILLILCLVIIMKPDLLGFDNAGMPTRISFALAGIWWWGFALLTFRRLPGNIYGKKVQSGQLLKKGYQELWKVTRELMKPEQLRLRLFLIAFFFYALGYMTVIYLATLFGSEELGMATAELIATVLIIQFVAIGGSYLFAWLSGKIGNIKSIMIAVVIWALVCGSTWFVTDAMGFYVVAFFVGTVMGGIQALSRATYAKLLPETHDHASYYSFYELMEKVGAVVGSLVYGLVIALTQSMRGSALMLAGFFFIGLVLLYFVQRLGGTRQTQKG